MGGPENGGYTELMKERLRSAGAAAKEALRGMSEDKATTMAAALAYYTVFSIAPLLVISIAAAGLVFGDGGGDQIFQSIRGLVGDDGGRAIRSMVEAAARKPRTGAVATALGVVALLFGASGVFGQLQESLNMIWRVGLKPTAGWPETIRHRLLSFGMVGVIAFILLVSLVVSAALSAAGKWMAGALPGGETVWQALNFAISFAVVSALFASVYKVLPDVRLPWREALAGGAATGGLFTLGKLGIGLYIGKSGVASAYGAAGSLVVVLLWVYYSSLIFLLGAELTRAWAAARGRPIAPKAEAEVTVTPFTVAAVAEKAVKEAEGADVDVIPSYWYAGAALSIASGGLLLRRSRSQAGSAAESSRFLGALSLGAGFGMLVLLEIVRRASPEEEGEEAKPSLAERLVKAIPLKVKLAALGGALKGAGAEAAHEASDAMRHRATHPRARARRHHRARSARRRAVRH